MGFETCNILYIYVVYITNSNQEPRSDDDSQAHQVAGLLDLVQPGQGACAECIAERGINLNRIFTHRYTLNDAEKARSLFDTQTTGKGGFSSQRRSWSAVHRRCHRPSHVFHRARRIAATNSSIG